MSILIPVPVPHTQTTLDIEGVRYLLMDPEVLRKAISAHPSISAERVTALVDVLKEARGQIAHLHGKIPLLERIDAALRAALTEAE